MRVAGGTFKVEVLADRLPFKIVCIVWFLKSITLFCILHVKVTYLANMWPFKKKKRPKNETKDPICCHMQPLYGLHSITKKVDFHWKHFYIQGRNKGCAGGGGCPGRDGCLY